MLTLCDLAHACGLHSVGRYVWTLRNYWRAVDRDSTAGQRYWQGELIA